MMNRILDISYHTLKVNCSKPNLASFYAFIPWIASLLILLCKVQSSGLLQSCFTLRLARGRPLLKSICNLLCYSISLARSHTPALLLSYQLRKWCSCFRPCSCAVPFPGLQSSNVIIAMFYSTQLLTNNISNMRDSYTSQTAWRPYICYLLSSSLQL